MDKSNFDTANSKTPNGQVEDSGSLTFGEKAVGVTFNPGKNEDVERHKRKIADVIDDLNKMRDETASPDKKRMYSHAITELQSAQMWAVKADTWQY